MKTDIEQDSPLVLIVDDDLTTRTLLRMLLKKDKYKIAEVENGEQCLEAYRQLKPDLVLMDAMMPVMDGFTCCLKLKKLPRGDRTPVLMITGLDDRESVDRAFEVGATDYVTKPIHPPLLRQRLRRILKAAKAEQGLRESEAKYRSVVNNLKEVIFQTDRAGRLIFLNPAWKSMTGFGLQQSLGKSFWEFIHPDDLSIHWQKFMPLLKETATNLLNNNLASFEFSSKHLLQSIYPHATFQGDNLTLLKINYRLLTKHAGYGGQTFPQTKECRYQIRFLKQDGGWGWMEIYAHLMSADDENPSGISGTINDITLQKAREKHSLAENATRQVLAESDTLTEAMPKILEKIAEHLDWDLGKIWLINEQTQKLQSVSLWHQPSFKNSPIVTSSDNSLLLTCEEKLINKIWQDEKPIWLNDLLEDCHEEFNNLVCQLELHSAFGIPIFGGNKKLGVIALFSRKNQNLDLDLLKVIAGLSSQIGQFIRRKQAEAQVQYQNLILRSELHKAADYVRSLLPSPLTHPIEVEQQFIPSIQLGGDAFDYYWLDRDRLLIYLLDVAGHGIQSALLSVSILNILRSQALYNTDFYQPWTVLEELNRVFPMNENGENYFTIWYGVYNLVNRELIYATAGHPPAILISSDLSVRQLGSYSLPIGMFPDSEFEVQTCKIPPGSTLYVFSDGIYEILLDNGKIWSLDALIDFLISQHQQQAIDSEQLIQYIHTLNKNQPFNDDISLLQIKM